MKNEKDSLTTRQHLLQAAGQLIMNEGVAHLTLEAVARQAGVSKGGLLYHFPNKEALIKGLVADLTAGFDQDLERELAQAAESEGAGKWSRAYVRATFNTAPAPGLTDIGSALLAAFATDPQLLDPLRQSFASYQAQAEADGLDPALATIIRLAADGLWLADLFELAPPQGELRQQVLARLLKLAKRED